MAAKRTPKGSNANDVISQKQMEKYLSKISDPLIDRIDIHVEVPPVPYKQLTGKRDGTTSKAIRERVMESRKIQSRRNGGPLHPNSRLTGRQLDNLAVLDESSQLLLREAMTTLGLSARAYNKIRRVARTIADLGGEESVSQQHVAEAIQYRLLDHVL